MDQTATALGQTLEAFLASSDFDEGVTKATKASWGGSGYSVELFEDGHWRVLWDNEIGNLYRSPGTIMSLPTWDDSDYQECLDNGMSEKNYWFECYLNEKDDLQQGMRDQFHDTMVWREMNEK